MPHGELCAVCDGTRWLLDDPCPLCGDEEVSESGSCSAEVGGGSDAAATGCLSPACVDAEDLALPLSQAVAEGHSAVRRLCRFFNGDTSLTYSVDDTGDVIRISAKAWRCFEELFQVAGEDNRERPFIVVMDRSRLRAVGVVVDKVGDENCCSHTEEAHSEAQAMALEYGLGSSAHLAFGHTHPVFWEEPAGPYGASMGCACALRPAPSTRRFGCFPSCIFSGRDEWLDALSSATPESRPAIEDILARKLYKKHGADYCEFISRQRDPCPGDAGGGCSTLEWILSPRLRQAGCFRVGRDGTIVYVRWVVEATEEH